MEKITLDGMGVGEVRELSQEGVYRALGLTGFAKPRTGGSRNSRS
jgi:23S rRNA pseudouridine2457 synthase